ncbi:MAG: hypothetical protein ACFHVJ_13850 [Aestuariibacter sp.]
MNQHINKQLLLWCIAIIAVVSVGLIPPIAQDLNYHYFADTRSLWGIPNGCNVLSNIPFFLVGLYGLHFVLHHKTQLQSLYWGAFTFVIGVSLVSLGSGYYHWSPNNDTLVWDRLPMTIAFMGLYAMVVSAFVHAESGVRLLPWLLLAGFASVIYWIVTETAGQGDLRWYALVQFLPMILTLVTLMIFQSKGINKSNLIAALVCYTFAKLFEFGDSFIFEFTGIVSGHCLKHLAAAVASYFVINWISAAGARN